MGTSKGLEFPIRFTTRQAAVVMFMITLAAPYGVFVTSSSYSYGEGLEIDFAIMAATWVFLTNVEAGGTSYGHTEPGFHLLSGDSLPYLLFMSVFGFLFAIAVVLRCEGRISRRRALIAGALTLFFPLTNALSALVIISGLFQIGVDPLFYAGPIPIQLAIGLYIMSTSSPSKGTGPWDD
ncbi:MAG: hypothetical protein ACFFC0_04380 [Promethearchaeota archaeon]